MIPAATRRALEQLARLDPGDLTAQGPVQMGTETARAILAALDDAETMRAVRALLECDRVSARALRALVATRGVETLDIRRERV